jgi:hypothetical protein
LIYTARDQRWLKRETMGRQRSEISNVVWVTYLE